MMRVHTPNPQDLDSLLHSFHETKNQEKALRQSIKAAIEEQVRVAKAQIESAEKTLNEAQRILHEVFGQTAEKNESVPSKVALEASRWRWFDKEVSGTTAVGVTDDSVPLSPVAGSTITDVHDGEDPPTFVSDLLVDTKMC
jgi:hypothetical protein